VSRPGRDRSDANDGTANEWYTSAPGPERGSPVDRHATSLSTPTAARLVRDHPAERLAISGWRSLQYHCLPVALIVRCLGNVESSNAGGTTAPRTPKNQHRNQRPANLDDGMGGLDGVGWSWSEFVGPVPADGTTADGRDDPEQEIVEPDDVSITGRVLQRILPAWWPSRECRPATQPHFRLWQTKSCRQSPAATVLDSSCRRAPYPERYRRRNDTNERRDRRPNPLCGAGRRLTRRDSASQIYPCLPQCTNSSLRIRLAGRGADP